MHASGGQAADAPNVLHDRIDATVRERVARSGVVGAVVGVWVPDRCDFLRGYGLSDLATGTAFSVGDSFRIGSITKTFTATAVLMLVDRGAFRLDDRLSDFIPGVPHGERITVRHLLNMTAGVYNYSDAPELTAPPGPTAAFGVRNVLRIVRENRPDFSPGAAGRWRYSNSNYILLGEIIEQAMGIPARQFLQTEIIDALGLTATSYPEGPEIPPPAARGYLSAQTGQPRRDVTNINPAVAGTAGAIISTISDLRRWSNALVTGTLLSEVSHAEQLTFVTSHPGTGYGAGLVNVNGYLGHDGGIYGYGAAMFQHPGTDTTIVVATNTSGAFETDTFAQLANLINTSSA